MNPGPLSGVRVIDLTIAAAGPYATGILAAQGAEVIKVEHPDGGDFMRSMGVVSHGMSALFAGWNRGKQSICVDLKQPVGADIVRRLAATADVFVHNLRPGNAEALGLGHDDLRALRPDLIYTILTGWGESGPRAGEPAYDSVIQAASGIAAVQADPATGEPAFVRTVICDKTTGLILSQLLTAALLHKARTGEGQRLHLSMLHAALAFVWPDGMQGNAFVDRPVGHLSGAAPPTRRTADGWMSISCNKDNEFQALCKVLDLPEVAADPRFHGGERSRNGAALWALVNPVLARRRTADLVAALAAHRVPHAVVNTRESVMDDPQVQALGVLGIEDHPQAGRIRAVRPPGDFGATPASPPAPAPALGADTDAVLAGLGMSPEQIARLRERRIVA